uniref:Uncharacterized protein n=1 Tax=viral metagenome TaxID=1070528 RepID=A0A6M3KTI6_9ZZZZ
MITTTVKVMVVWPRSFGEAHATISELDKASAALRSLSDPGYDRLPVIELAIKTYLNARKALASSSEHTYKGGERVQFDQFNSTGESLDHPRSVTPTSQTKPLTPDDDPF